MKIEPLVLEGPHGSLRLSPSSVTGERFANGPFRYVVVAVTCGAFEGSSSFFPLEADFQAFCRDLVTLSSGAPAVARLTCGPNEELLLQVQPLEAHRVVEV